LNAGFPSLTRLEFGHACGDHGLYWDGNLVVKVSAQALKLGVRPGWKIHMIDGHAVHDGNDIWMRLQEARWQWRSCSVSFVTDTACIRAERARARAAAIRAEEERLAKLAFEGSGDGAHLAQVHQEFQFQGYIDRPEDRAITMEQLHRVVRWSRDHCHRWRDAAPVDESRTSGMKLNLDIMNTYHLSHWLIKPATKDKNCALIEFLTNQKQQPSWCVIHWWGERIVDLVKCLECQVSTRNLPGHTGFWISAFAIRPHLMLQEDFSDPARVRFYRALVASQSRALLVLDSRREHTGPATALGRLWCLYELALCLDQPALTLDVATLSGSRAALVMRGFTGEEELLEGRSPGAGYRAKSDRERGLGLDLVERGLEIRLQGASTTEPGDRARLLNGLAGREASLPPIEDHELYRRANRRLRALFALSFWRRVMASASNDSGMHRLQARMADAVRGDAWRSSMDVCMAYCAATAPEEKLAVLQRSFPPGLRELRLDLRGLDIANDSMASLAAGLPRELEDLTLDLAQNAQVDNLGITAFINALPPRQRAVSLGLAGTSVSQEFQERRDSLDGLREQIVHEAQKGSVCIALNLAPSPDRRMHVSTSRTKV